MSQNLQCDIGDKEIVIFVTLQCCVTFKIVTLVTKKCDKVCKLSHLNLSVTCVTLLNCDISNKFDHNIKV